MSTIKVTNLQNASAASPAIVLDANSRATLNGLSYPTEGSLSGRNRIINGSMTVDQRNAGASVTPNLLAYPVDRTFGYGSVTGKFSCQQNSGSVTPPAGFTNYVGAVSLSTYSVPAGEQYIFGHVIEGLNVADLAWGSANAATVTLSFWVRSSLTGTFGGSLQNDGFTRSYPFSYAISAANTWEKKSITIPGDTTGTWLTNNGAGIRLGFSLGSGTTMSGTAGSWAGANYVSATGATSVVGTNGATFYITGVQLEAGSVATPFERRNYAQELMLCQRYFNRYNFQSAGWNTSATNSIGAFTFPVMRDTPNYSLVAASVAYGPGGQQSVSSLNGIGIDKSSMRSGFVIGGGLTINAGSVIFGTIDLEKEL